MTIEVFKTNIDEPAAVQLALEALKTSCPKWKINIDLHDCDNILRIESPEHIDSRMVSSQLLQLGYIAEVLD